MVIESDDDDEENDDTRPPARLETSTSLCILHYYNLYHRLFAMLRLVSSASRPASTGILGVVAPSTSHLQGELQQTAL